VNCGPISLLQYRTTSGLRLELLQVRLTASSSSRLKLNNGKPETITKFES